MAEKGWELGGAFMGEVLKALTDKQGQVDIRMRNVALDWKGTPLGLELNGTITVSVHMRELSDKEKAAHQDSTVANLRRSG
ncbi:MAG TPA: hypothetical protein VGV64_02915 [Thermoplasmata archaeon]|nr:hypothetical protein [Thermoplasmata archaeon]HEV2428782.1 hypothetical protein [Thermoplasmata archaeon]